MDIASIANITKIDSATLVDAYNKNRERIGAPAVDNSAFGSLLTKAMDTIGTTNAYSSNAQNEEVKWALGETESTHELTNALQKSSVALQYTVAIRDKVLEAYKEIMQMQI